MHEITNKTAVMNNVNPQHLEFIGIQDERHTVGKMIYHFNILDPAHQRYGSTVTYMVNCAG